MLQASTIKFIKELKKNNNKPWFDANRKLYENAKADFASLVDAIITATSKFDNAISNLKAKDCMFRINRDVRFSKDKSPYKSNMGAYMNPGGKKVNTPGYYFQCEPGQSFAAGGLYVPEPEALAKVRQEIDYNFDEWKAIISNKNFKKYFAKVDGIEVLSRPPKGYEANNPAIEFLKMKSFIVSRQISDAELLDKKLVKEIARTFETMKPMTDFLNHAIQ
ncbi:MAG: DUF2461 domain-containing protein [Chitinophagaceae bacterium]|nr:DUF2461 domain-containing protein [Chitinophagaceae bacterium]